MPFPDDALEPFLSRTTMRAHLEKHRRYVDTVNALVPDFLRHKIPEGMTMQDVYRVAEAEHYFQLFDAASQAWYHALFWRCLDPEREGDEFDGIEPRARDLFEQGMRHFGSGWACLVDQAKLRAFALESVVNAARPTAETMAGGRTAFVVDLWEHAWYYDHPDGKRAYLHELLLGGYARWDVLDEPEETGGVWGG